MGRYACDAQCDLVALSDYVQTFFFEIENSEHEATLTVQGDQKVFKPKTTSGQRKKLGSTLLMQRTEPDQRPRWYFFGLAMKRLTRAGLCEIVEDKTE